MITQHLTVNFKGLTVVQATSHRQLEQIYRLRHDYYCNGKLTPGANSNSGLEFDEHDKDAVHVMAEKDKELLGCFRINLRDPAYGRYTPIEVNQFPVQQVTGGQRAIEITRLIITRPRQIRLAILPLVKYIYHFSLRNEIRYILAAATQKNTALYENMGLKNTGEPGLYFPFTEPHQMLAVSIDDLTASVSARQSRAADYVLDRS